jgi:predicted ATPase
MESSQLSRLLLQGFKSIRECDLQFNALNILIGANGAGKTNLVEFFRFIQHLLYGKLQIYVSKKGGPDALLHFGRKKTEQLHFEIYFGKNGYQATLEPTLDNRMVFTQESLWWEKMPNPFFLGGGHFETLAEEVKTRTRIYDYTLPVMKGWFIYHFHDTGEDSRIKQSHRIDDNEFLRSDARNLAAFLFRLSEEYPSYYKKIVKTIQLMAPFFDNFFFRPMSENRQYIELEWLEKGEELPFKAHSLSDGTLRFICLATVLMQPKELQPELILIDEPELGLHPVAIRLLASMLRSASTEKQVIVSTQSPDLLNEFDPDDVIVAERHDSSTFFLRLDAVSLEEWLQEYSLGELWKKNLFGGRPSR